MWEDSGGFYGLGPHSGANHNFFKLCTDDPTLEKRLSGVYTCNPGWSIYNGGTPKSPVITVGLSYNSTDYRVEISPQLETRFF